jgi:hypothetical protein
VGGESIRAALVREEPRLLAHPAAAIGDRAWLSSCT